MRLLGQSCQQPQVAGQMAGHGVALPSGTDCSDLAGPWVGAGNRPRCCHPPIHSGVTSGLFLCRDFTAFIVPLGKERQGSGAGWAPDPAASANRDGCHLRKTEEKSGVRVTEHHCFRTIGEEERGCESAEKRLHSALAGGERNSAQV